MCVLVEVNLFSLLLEMTNLHACCHSSSPNLGIVPLVVGIQLAEELAIESDIPLDIDSVETTHKSVRTWIGDENSRQPPSKLDLSIILYPPDTSDGPRQ
jgi:hypothetical protein